MISLLSFFKFSEVIVLDDSLLDRCGHIVNKFHSQTLTSPPPLSSVSRLYTQPGDDNLGFFLTSSLILFIYNLFCLTEQMLLEQFLATLKSFIQCSRSVNNSYGSG
jgi:hypothetical protein